MKFIISISLIFLIIMVIRSILTTGNSKNYKQEEKEYVQDDNGLTKEKTEAFLKRQAKIKKGGIK